MTTHQLAEEIVSNLIKKEKGRELLETLDTLYEASGEDFRAQLFFVIARKIAGLTP